MIQENHPTSNPGTGREADADIFDTDPRLKAFGFAPGGYQCKCGKCETVFVGDKRAVICFSCAARSLRLSLVEAPASPPAPASPGTVQAPAAGPLVDWTDPGHRLTETELNAAENTYHGVRRGRTGAPSTVRAALEAVIRGFLAMQPRAGAPSAGRPGESIDYRKSFENLQKEFGALWLENHRLRAQGEKTKP